MGDSHNFTHKLHINIQLFTNTTNNAKMVKAVATVRGDSKVSGTVTFEQASESSPTPSLGISPETILMPSVACTSINSVTTPTAAHPLAPTSTLTARRTVLLPTRPVMLVTWATSRPMDKATERAQPLTSSSS